MDQGRHLPVLWQKELYTHAQNSWVLRCGRESKCGDTFHVKDLFDDLFND